ncbi:16S rRNA (cytidine1402-2'-O)-methyltransferase [Lachnospiraceae bacterium NE2001]|nr:16S rRNA (cytidine1402-2'-O)-methyltransferase [Lachnospiraceae bacterium NE2001]
MSGILYLVATPIGNLEDMTYRAVNTLREVDIIAAEDTRNSIKLLNHFEIKTPMTSYHEFNRFEKAEYLVKCLEEGKSIAVITDAGTPGISDPGEVLVQMCHERGIQVVPIPGAVAAVNALVASGQKTRRFAFEAFLPLDKDKKDKKELERILGELREETRTIVLYEAPHRLVKTLELLAGELGETRSLTICKEITKKHESFWKTTFGEALEFFGSEDHSPRGEYVLVIAGKSEEELEEENRLGWEGLSIEEHLKKYLDQGVEKKEAVKLVAKERGVRKQDVYLVAVNIN